MNLEALTDTQLSAVEAALLLGDEPVVQPTSPGCGTVHVAGFLVATIERAKFGYAWSIKLAWPKHGTYFSDWRNILTDEFNYKFRLDQSLLGWFRNFRHDLISWGSDAQPDR